MRPGLFPSQQRLIEKAFKKADKFDHFRQRTRRTFLLGGAFSIAMASVSFWAGTCWSQRTPREPLDRWMALATGPMSDLRQRAIPFLQALGGRPAQDPVWQGFHRLVADALCAAGDTPMRRMLVQIGRRADAPPAAREVVDMLVPRGR